MPKTAFFRIAQEGTTTDRRVIEAKWIDQAAANYDPKKYGARVNLEHFRGLLPDGPFKMYGDVLALKAETIDGKRTLLAQIDPTPELIALNKARQKLYTSCEIDPDFSDSSEAYLVGLAVTDSPASLGTEMLKFAAGQGDQSPLAVRKLHANTHFTAAEAFQLELQSEPGDAIKSVIEKLTGLFKSTEKLSQGEADTSKALDAVAEHLKTVETRFGEIGDVRQTVDELKATVNATNQQLAETVTTLSALTTKLNFTLQTPPRPVAAGGGGQIVTDC
ncbi:phage capsid scaffolding protein [Chitinimonas prasina]|uniref:Phage capsid scaffolding protein n=1 Tax=Chitinimonas prasina TaxID=1434937 RepID=A0ABQ5YGW1_9NEIS|nr:GPO family capsid scaffolding protein [Chitinimonas prasina]GLR13248.1 phage capsid scaffolding protein [Chitinimonas prasina]